MSLSAGTGIASCVSGTCWVPPLSQDESRLWVSGFQDELQSVHMPEAVDERNEHTKLSGAVCTSKPTDLNAAERVQNVNMASPD